MPRPVRPGVVFEAAHGIPLVEPGEDRRLALGVHEPAQQIQPGVALPHLLPQIPGAMTAGSGGFPALLPSPWLNGKKSVDPLGQPGRHEHLLGVHREMHHRPPHQRSLGVPIGPYCAFACSTVWPVNGFFNSAVATGIPFTNNPRSSVFADPGSIRQLAGHRQPVRRVPRLQLRVQTRRRTEVRQLELGLLHARIHHPVTQHIHRAPRVQLLRQPIQERPLRRLRRRRASCGPSPTPHPASPR